MCWDPSQEKPSEDPLPHLLVCPQQPARQASPSPGAPRRPLAPEGQREGWWLEIASDTAMPGHRDICILYHSYCRWLRWGPPQLCYFRGRDMVPAWPIRESFSDTDLSWARKKPLWDFGKSYWE